MKFELNNNGRDFVVGDIHGCLGLFNDMLERIEFDLEKDRMFSVGDLIDRGENSLDCLYLIEQPWFHAVLGNHEDMMIEKILNGKDTGLWEANGGTWHLYVDQNELKNLVVLANDLPLAITVETEKGKVGICHAEPPSFGWQDTENPDERQRTIMIWGRSWMKAGDYTNVTDIYKTYHGHTIIGEPITMGNVNFIDTGAFHTGNLTCVQL